MTEHKKQCHGNKILCHCKQVSVRDIRIAMVNGARTLDDIKEMTGAGTGCGRCTEEIERILKMLCKCKKVSVEEVVNAVKNGADTVEKVEEVTGAGSPCGKCRRLIENIIELKR